MAANKKQEKVRVKDVAAAKARTAKKAAAPAGKTPPAKPAKVAVQAPAKARGSAVPTALTCPLVLDGEIDAADFSPVLCLKCDEFDCRFCEAVAGSGSLQSRLFANPDEEECDDDWDSGAGFREEDDDDADIDEEKIF